jgi:hypothetical protein
MTTIIEALQLLDVTNDDHWTADGLPRVDVIASIVNEKSLKRGDITKAAPTFTRENPTTEVVAEPEAEVVAEDVILPSAGEIDPQLLNQEPVFHDKPKSLEEQLAEAKAKLEEAQSFVDAAKNKFNEVQKEIDALVEAQENTKDPHANQLAICEYLATQQRLREERSGTKAPIDQVMVRKTGFGIGRPLTPKKQ